MNLFILSDEQLIKAFLKASKKKSDETLTKLLYKEIIVRGLLFETLLKVNSRWK